MSMSNEANRIPPVTTSRENHVLALYEAQISVLRVRLTAEQSTRLYALIGTMLCAALTAAAIALFILHATLPIFLATLPVACALALWSRYVSSGKRWKRIVQEIDYFERGVRRLTASWQGKGETGQEFAREKHLYQSDLNILGEGSLFELLCTTRSRVGAERLATYLLDPVDQDESRRRQEAVKELTGFNHLREEIHRLGDYRSDDCSIGSFDKWFSMVPLIVHPIVRYVLLLSSSATVFVGLGIVARTLLWTQWTPLLVSLIVAQTAIAGLLLKKTRPRLHQLRLITNAFTVLHGGLSLMGQQNFKSPKLQELTERVRSTNAAAHVRRIERLARLLDQREKMEFYAVSLLSVVATQVVLAMESWRASYQNDFMGWVDAWAEFEALQALAGYAFEQPCTVFPELLRDDPAFEAQRLGHPLLEVGCCICNDVELNTRSRFYLVSGSNMAGKSTFLRAIGLNAVIALAGGPVRATSARLSQLTVCASLAITDSLLEGRSKFLAEVERLGAMIASNDTGKPILFLIDEIFSGTNSQDRKAAAQSVIYTLLEGGAVGAISTHDLALTEMTKDPAKGGILVHMESNNPDDPLDFDYLVKPGVSTRSNAMAIVRMIGLSKTRSSTNARKA